MWGANGSCIVFAQVHKAIQYSVIAKLLGDLSYWNKTMQFQLTLYML